MMDRINVFDLEYFFELSPDLLCVAGFDGYFKKINPAVSKTLGYSEEELFARPINSFIHPEDRDLTNEKREMIKKGAPLLNFENRYLAKSGETVWLYWTSMPIERDKLVFAIAKNITYKKKVDEYWRISDILGNAAPEKPMLLEEQNADQNAPKVLFLRDPSPADQIWLQEFENIVRKYIGKIDLNLSLLCNELAVSQRALFRRVQSICGLTPNQLIRVIRLQVAWEAIGTGKYRTIAELSAVAGFETPGYFSKLFKQIYGLSALELLK